MVHVSIGAAASMLGVAVSTLRRWHAAALPQGDLSQGQDDRGQCGNTGMLLAHKIVLHALRAVDQHMDMQMAEVAERYWHSGSPWARRQMQQAGCIVPALDGKPLRH